MANLDQDVAAAGPDIFQAQWSVSVIKSSSGPVGSNVAPGNHVKEAMEKLDRRDLTRLINKKTSDKITGLNANDPPAEVGSFGGGASTSARLSKMFKAFKTGLYAEVDSNKLEVVTFTL